MAIVLDTSVLVALEKDNKDIISKLRKISEFHKTRPFVASISLAEIMCGALNQNIKKQIKVIENFKDYHILNSSFSSSMILANFSHVLNKKGKRIPITDLIIASIAIDNDLNLVTLDNHFNRIPGLNVLYIGK
ncbi:PIN domain-containing protein [Candidatus Woesearchaeota archaeon]|nr:PIN domain-containing protein [Candidatus Woesearchaeota archaeon]